MNPMSQNNNQLMMIKNLYNLCQSSQNPTQLLEQMATQNPQLKPFASLLKQGYSPEQVFNQACQERGLNPNEFIESIKGIIGNSR